MDSWFPEFRFNVENIRNNPSEFMEEITEIMQSTNPEYQLVYSDGVKCALFTDSKDVRILLQGKEDGVYTVDIHNSNADNSDLEKIVRRLESLMKQSKFSTKSPGYLYMPKIQRGRQIIPYDQVSGDLVERDFDKEVLDEVTPFQHIRVFHSRRYGNCLYIDNDLNIAESDYEKYSYGMTGFGNANFEGKTVLILGGGDGCVLRYLKDKGPAMITIVDIDQKIIDVSRVHLRKICQDVLDPPRGENYEIIVDDAVNHLEWSVQNGRQYDYVINEINHIYVSEISVGSEWNFLWKILVLSMKVLKNEGMYFAHGTSERHPDALAMYEAKLKDLNVPVVFKKEAVPVPSYLENWVFYAIWKDIRGAQL